MEMLDANDARCKIRKRRFRKRSVAHCTRVNVAQATGAQSSVKQSESAIAFWNME